MLYYRSLGRSATVAAALLQATSLPFLVTAATIGMQTDFISPTTGAALVCAGLLSVMIFPALAGPQLPQRAEAAGVRDRVAMHSEAM